MLQHGFYFFANLMTFLSKKKDQMFSFHIYFSHLCKISNQKKKKRLIVTCVFECFQSHCHILKELHEFLGMMGAIIIFVGKDSSPTKLCTPPNSGLYHTQ